MRDSRIKMFEYNGWANNKVFEQLSSLPSSILTKEIMSVFPTLKDVLVHIYVINHGWLDAIKGHEVNDVKELGKKVKSLTEFTNGKSLGELRELYHSLHLKTIDAIENIDNLDGEVSVLFGYANFSYIDIVNHIVNYGTYHRGNLTAMLRQLGHSCCPTDYSLFLFEI
ncbi:damage-inducible protein DinB (plasmid) [Bacillus thuringiensis]|uniref:DinB family protein n=1 Tax=Bacillus thuringiensis TaxID=1428 RepID=UPI002224F5FD|nr:DinB family protein [Bacillus thuringiensis]UYX55591.1 damage-inducible protein DinB [Bacillus thuringiensis]